MKLFADKNDLVTLKGRDGKKHDGVVVKTESRDDGRFLCTVAYLDGGKLVRRVINNQTLLSIHETTCKPSKSALKAEMAA